MVHPLKKQRLDDGHQRNDVMAAGNDYYAVTFDDLADVLPNILGFLPPTDIMCKRQVCKKWGAAAKKTIVPITEFRVNSMEKYNAMGVLTRAMPNLQQITLRGLRGRHKYSEGEDPDEWWVAGTAEWTTHDIDIISNFSKLRILEICSAPLNGRYPFLFNSFPLLQKLSIKHCPSLKWDLEMLSGFPLLKELECRSNPNTNDCLTGNISSLRVLKETLEKVKIDRCYDVVGNFMDLADFPHLKELDLDETAVTGDIRDIGVNDFSSLEHLVLPKRVYGGKGYEIQRISDAPDVVRAVYLLRKQRPALEMKGWYMRLSKDSLDWYGHMNFYAPPLYIRFVEADLALDIDGKLKTKTADRAK